MKKILIGVTGGIAAYKACDLVSRLVKNGDEVKVIMTDNACRFVLSKPSVIIRSTRILLPPVWMARSTISA